MLERGNFFLIPLDQSREWFRYHHLAADLLRAQLKMSVPDEEIATLHLRAAEWYRRHSMAEEAIRHAFLAGAEKLAGELIAQFMPEALSRYELKTVGRWVKALSEEVIRQNIDLVIGTAAYYALLGQPEQIEKYVGWAENLLETNEFADPKRMDHVKGQVLALKFQLLVYQEHLLEASKAAETALDLLPQEGVMRLWVLTQLADIYLWVAKVEQAEMAAQQAVAVSQRLHRDIDTITAYVGLAHVFFMQGKLRLEMEYYQKALALDPKIAGEYSPFSCITLIRIASNHRWAHRLEEAYQTALMGVALAERWREGEYLLEAYVELASVLGGMREFERSLETIGKAQKIAGAQSQWLQHQVEHRLMYLKTLQAMDAGLPMDEPLGWAQEKLAQLTIPVPAANIPMLVVAAMILVTADEAECSLRIVDAIEAGERIARRISMLLMIWPIKALACWKSGQPEAAFAVLDEALPTVVTEGSVHHYLDLNEPMHTLLKAYANQCRDTRYVSRLLTCFGEEQHSEFHLSDDGLVENLTPREQEVLELIALGFTNQGIADELYLAEATVKKHVSNIYGKLGVRKRTQAVQRARELKLID
jgi:LuxR family maltose regulon positive regulatory protein